MRNHHQLHVFPSKRSQCRRRFVWISTFWVGVVVSCLFASLSLATATTIEQRQDHAGVIGNSGDGNTVLIDIPTMHCGGCAKKIKKALQTVPGVSLVETNLYPKNEQKDGGYAKVMLHSDDDSTSSNGHSNLQKTLLSAVDKAGFAFASIVAATAPKEEEEHEKKSKETNKAQEEL